MKVLLISSFLVLSLALLPKNNRHLKPSRLNAANGSDRISKINQSIKRFLASISIGLPGFASGAFKSAVALTSIVGIAPNAANALPFKKYSNLAATQKLGTTPVFFLSNSGGNPYLQEDVQAGKPDQRIVTYFMSSEDASEYLNEIAQGNPANVNEFRIMTSTMEKVRLF